MSLDSRFLSVLDALETSLETEYTTASVYIGKQTNEAEKVLDISLRGGPGVTDGVSGVWRYPINIIVNTHGADNEPDDAVSNVGDVMQTIQEHFLSENTEPLDSSGYWGQVLRMDPIYEKKPYGYYNRYTIRAIVYFYEAGLGTLGTITLAYGGVTITLTAGIDIDWSISKPETIFTPTSNELPYGIDRRSYYSDFRISALIVGSTARTSAKALQTMLKKQFGAFGSNYITMTFTGALKDMYDTSFNVAPSLGTQVHIRVKDSEQFVVRISGLSLREVRT